jgi:hypothetical protein
MHKIRIHIMHVLKCDPRWLSGARRIKAKLQEAREKTTGKMIHHQPIRNTLKKMKDSLEEILDEDEVDNRRKRAKLTKRIGTVLPLPDNYRMRNFFSTTDDDGI